MDDYVSRDRSSGDCTSFPGRSGGLDFPGALTVGLSILGILGGKGKRGQLPEYIILFRSARHRQTSLTRNARLPLHPADSVHTSIWPEVVRQPGGRTDLPFRQTIRMG